MKSNPQLLLNAMDTLSCEQDLLVSVGPDKAKVIREIVDIEKTKFVVELGGYCGYSAILFADLLRRQNTNGHKTLVWGLEMESHFAPIATRCIDIAGLADFVNVVAGPASESLRRLKADGNLDHIDMLLLDHAESLYMGDLQLIMNELSLLPEGAVILANNVVRLGAPQYRDYVRGHEGLASKGVRGLIMPGDFEVSKNLQHSCRHS